MQPLTYIDREALAAKLLEEKKQVSLFPKDGGKK
jgi:hypothetical protein